jgi:hypothetical protein
VVRGQEGMWLGHSVEQCNRPLSLIVCPHCGGPHTASEHVFHCPNMTKHRGQQCNCPPFCFLCHKKQKKADRHNALSNGCPLRALFCSPLTKSDTDIHPQPTDGEGNNTIPDARSGSETLPLTPGHKGPFTVLTPANITSIAAQGTPVEDIIKSLVPPEVTDLVHPHD